MSHIAPATPKVQETITVTTASVGCDGGGGRYGHPLVYLNVAQKGEARCPYCSRLYVLDRTAKLDHGH